MKKNISDIESRIEIRSDSVNEILGRPPRWLVRWGVTVVFSLMVILLTGSAFYSYPDILSAPIVISSGNLPVQMIARFSGKIRLLVNESDIVKEKEVLAYIENPVAYEAYIKLSSMLYDSISSIYKIKDDRISLGNLQDYYQNLLASVKEYCEFLKMDYYTQKIQQQETLLKLQVKNTKSFEIQATQISEQLKIATRNFERDSLLFIKSTISSLELEKSKSSYLSVLQQYESAILTCNSAQIAMNQTIQYINDTKKEKFDQLRRFNQTIISSIEVLKAKVEEWKLQYLLISPINGKVSLNRFWQSNQNINAGDILLTIIPSETSYLIGKIYLPLVGAGKVECGQKVNIKLDNYPFMEFGLLQSTVSNISASSITQDKQKQLLVTLNFKDSLKTNYQFKIPMKEELTGTAEIITKNMNAFERITSPIKYILRKK